MAAPQPLTDPWQHCLNRLSGDIPQRIGGRIVAAQMLVDVGGNGVGMHGERKGGRSALFADLANHVTKIVEVCAASAKFSAKAAVLRVKAPEAS